MAKFRNKYRIESFRAQWWDYGWNGAYFITISTARREHFFGKILNEKMHLSQMGQIADTLWQKIPDQFPYANLGKFIIMPDHMHGILLIQKTEQPGQTRLIEEQTEQTRLIASQQGGITGDKNPMIQENISRIIRWYKGRCTFEIRKIHPPFAWHPRFHDHIIRDPIAYDRITNYIINNPKNWEKGRND